MYFDLDQQPTQMRTNFRTGHDKGTLYSENGITYSAADWKDISDEAGRFLTLTYKQNFQGTTYRGYARRTIRNGYTITVDFRVTDRELKSADRNALVDVMLTWKFTEIEGLPPTRWAQWFLKLSLQRKPIRAAFRWKATARRGCGLLA